MSDTVSSTLNYFQPPKDGSRPFLHINKIDPATGEHLRNWVTIPKQIQVTNLRGQKDMVTLDTAGFEYHKNDASHKRFVDDEEIKREYYPESEALLKKLTGANRVILFDHTIRKHRPGALGDTPDKRKPVQLVHVDQTPASAERRVHMHAPPELVSELLKHRYQIVNLWRPISHPAVDFPLALCDYRSIDLDKDLAPTALVYPDREGETFYVKYSPTHRWNYFSALNTDEIILIKCFDSDRSVATLTPHTAFIDPTTPKDAPLRESIELRALIFYDN